MPPPLSRAARDEKTAALLSILGAAFRRLRGLHSNLRKDRYRERQFGLCDVYSHHGHPLVAALIVYASGNWQQPSTVSAKTWLFLILSGAATDASWICYFRALKLGDAERVAPIDKLSVVLVSVFAVLFLGERLALPNWLGVILIACGAVLLAYRA